MYKILVCDDDREIVEAIEIYLSQEGYQILKAYDGIEALEILEKEEVNLLIIDVMMPRLDGIRATLKIREKNSLPIIILSAKSEDTDKILGLNIGADDYVTKPFSPLTLIARMKALHRRAEVAEAAHDTSENTDETFDVITDHFKMNTKTRETYLDNQLIEGLTPKEFDLLYTLAKKPRQVFSREQLLELVWDYQYFGDERTVDAHIKKLRQKIEKVGPQVIQTVWGVGYKFDDSGVA